MSRILNCERFPSGALLNQVGRKYVLLLPPVRLILTCVNDSSKYVDKQSETLKSIFLEIVHTLIQIDE